MITFLSGHKIYIRYNDYDEYSYQFNFSQEPYDRFRFDTRWNVSSKPHHFHPRGQKNASESPMTGDPNHDMPLLITYLPIKKKIES